MSATAQKTITVTGTELSKLSAGMLTVANNTVASVVLFSKLFALNFIIISQNKRRYRIKYSAA